MAVTVPLRYLRYHGPNIVGMFGQGLRSAMPWHQRRQVDLPGRTIERELPPVPEQLVAAYARWAGAPPARYARTVPPHMVCYWGMNLIAELTAQAPYNLLTVLNQGCRIDINAHLQQGQSIRVRGHLAGIDQDGRRVRIASHLDVGNGDYSAQRIDVMASVPLNGKAARKPATPPEDISFETLSRWSAGADDGINFALLTGDFNPIHTLKPVARMTRYGGCILHGFGFFSRTYEAIMNSGVRIADIDVRFVRPLPLPAHALEVQLARETGDDGWRALRLLGSDGAVHLAGRLQEGRA